MSLVMLLLEYKLPEMLITNRLMNRENKNLFVQFLAKLKIRMWK